MIGSTSYGNVSSGNDNRVEIGVKCITEGLRIKFNNVRSSFPGDSFRKHLTVVPAKVTVAPVWRLWRSMVLEGGAEMLERTILVQDSTAEEMDAYSVTTQASAATEASATLLETVEVGAGVVSGTSAEEDWVVTGRVVFTKVVFVSSGVLVETEGTATVLVIAAGALVG